MKKIFAIAICSIVLMTPITSHAETFAEKCQRLQRESDKEFVEGLERDGNLTQEAIDAFHLEGKKPQKKTTKNSSTGNTAGTTSGKGWIYSTDELHVVGLPEDERGYTKAGDYGVIPKD